MIVLLFEDARVEGLVPLSYTRPVFELRTGALNLRERVAMLAPEATVVAKVREVLRPLLEESLADLAAPLESTERVVVLNGRLDVSFSDLRTLLARTQEGAVYVGETLAAAWLPEGAQRDLAACLEQAAALPRVETGLQLRLHAHVWDLVHANDDALRDDFVALKEHGSPHRRLFGTCFRPDSDRPRVLQAHSFTDESQAILYPGVHLVSPERILFGPGAKILPGAVLDAEAGPIVLGAGCRIAPNATLEGPLYLGPGSVVNPGAKLREGTSAGAFCKLGGEIEASILLDLSNKQHEGFLGHAYLGSWVNLGADTNGSDLKNTYGTVRVDLGDGPLDTGETFVGPSIGDHAKTGINTMLSTGAVIGVAANVFGGGFPPKFIPSFAWGGDGSWTEHDLEKATRTAETVLARRDVVWSDAQATLLRHVFESTRHHR